MSGDSDVSEVELSEEEHSQAGDQFLRTARVPRTSDHTDASYESDEQHSQQLRSISVPAPANSWQDVDREQLSQTVLRLISSVAQTAPTDDKSRDAVWHPTTTITVTQNLNDPLGFGTIDLASRRLVAAEDDEQQQQEPQATAAVGTGQGKGAVGRFFSDLTKSSTATKHKRSSKHPTNTTTTSQHRSNSLAAHGVLAHVPASKLLPAAEGFDPEAYLAVFHGGSSAAELAQGLRALERELGESTGQLKQLVKQNFERFISCKTTIDDIYTKLQRIESTSTGISTEVLYQAIQEVQSGASRVFGPILERAGKAERIRSVQLLLKRFQGLFSAPDRITALAAARDFEQVTAEFRKANALIKPGPKSVKVWISLYAEIEKRVTEVYHQLESEVQDPLLPAAAASELVVHMAQLQAEGLAAAAGADPLALLLGAREAQFTATMQAVAADHERAVARLKADMAAAAAAVDDKLQDPAAITEAQLLKWNSSWNSSSSIRTLDNTVTAAATAAGSSGLAAVPGSRHLSDLAPLSGLQPPPPRSRLVHHTHATPGELLYLKYLQRQSAVLLECLPGLWQAAGAGTASKLQLPLNLTAAATANIQATVAGAAKILERLVSTYSDSARHIITALAAAGPLRDSLLLAAEELAAAISHLESQKAPAAAVAAVAAVLGGCISAGVQQLVVHLGAVPGWLLSKETWQLSVTHSGAQPITHMPEQLQEEVTVAMQYYQQLLACSSNSSSGPNSSSTAAKFVPADKSTKPVRDAYFACLEDTIKCCRTAADHLRPAGTAASTGSSSTVPGMSSSSRSKPSSAYDPLLVDSDDEDSTASNAAAATPDSAAAAGAALRPRQLSDDVRLLLLASNLAFMRSRLVGSLTQRFLLVLTGEVASELERCSRYVVKLAGRLDTAVQAIHGVYLDRKRRSIARLISQYIRHDGSSVGAPPELREVSTHAQQMVTLVTAVMSETYTYARPSMQQLLYAVLEHMGSSLSTAFANLPAAAGPAASGSAAAGCPVESLGQYFMDLVYLDATLSKAGPPALSVDLTAVYQLLATRMCGSGSSSSRDRLTAETPLAHSLLAIKDSQELSRKLQVTCRKALRDVLERSSFTLRSLLAPVAAAGMKQQHMCS